MFFLSITGFYRVFFPSPYHEIGIKKTIEGLVDSSSDNTEKKLGKRLVKSNKVSANKIALLAKAKLD